MGANIALGVADGILGNADAVSSALDAINQVPSPAAVKSEWVSGTSYAGASVQQSGGTTQNAGQETPIVIQLQLVMDKRVVGEASVEYINRETKRTGTNPVVAYL